MKLTSKHKGLRQIVSARGLLCFLAVGLSECDYGFSNRIWDVSEKFLGRLPRFR